MCIAKVMISCMFECVCIQQRLYICLCVFMRVIMASDEREDVTELRTPDRGTSVEQWCRTEG